MKRVLILVSILFSLLCGISGESYGQTSEAYPVKPINFIIAAEAGSDSDVNGRPLLEKLQLCWVSLSCLCLNREEGKP